ncbi:1-phosphofructokinase, partial [Lancefieldella parvula]|uniref:1-phosphofructokinase n=1 Tax=Lancefieldella parvula TaxID=1382 RepID=UPI0028807797
MPSIYTVTLNPALDKTVHVPNFTVDQVNRINWLRRDAGGKGINVSKVIAKLGGESTAIAVLAGQTGQWIANALDENNIKVHAITVPGETRTNLKVVDTEGGTNTDINEPGPEVTDSVLDQALVDIVSKTSSGDIVVLSGSLPRGASTNTYGRWTRALRDAGLKVYLDADGAALSAGLEQKPYFTKPNDHELSAMLGRELVDVDAIATAASKIVAGGIDTVCVSMGGNGAVYATTNEVWYAGPVKVKVGSTVGAGDSVVAAFAFADAQGLSTE